MEKLSEVLIKFCPPFILACWFDMRTLFGLMFVLLFLDTVVAIYAAWKLHPEGQKWFHREKLLKTVEKFIAYGMTA